MKILSILSILLLALSCSSAKDMMKKVRPGMSPEQVEKALGPTEGFKSKEVGEDQFLMYTYNSIYCNPNASYDMCDFYILFKNNKVIETDMKDVRSKQAPQTGNFIIFNQ